MSQLVKKLITVNTSLITSSQHADIYQCLKFPTGIPAELDTYKQRVSSFCLDAMTKEYN